MSMSHDRQRRSSANDDPERIEHRAAPGKRPATAALLQRKASGSATGDASAALGAASGSSGHSLPGGLQSQLEGSLGANLSSVRVHTGAPSATAASAVGANAFAVGQDIHFGAGNFQPSTPAGQGLIAHEVAHTVQQRGGQAWQNKLEVSAPGDAHEVQADQFSAAFSMGVGHLAPVAAGSVAGSLSRDDEESGGLAGMALGLIIDRISDVGSLLSAIGNVSVSIGRTVIRTIAQRAPELIMSFVRLQPAHQLYTYAIQHLPRAQIQELMNSFELPQVQRALRAIRDAGLLLTFGPIIFALNPQRARQILANLDADVLRPLISGAGDLARRFAETALNDYWPAGLGINVSAGIGATWGYPIYTGADAMFVLARTTPDKFQFRRRGEARVAADSGAGVGVFIGTGGRSRGGGTSGGGGDDQAGGMGIGASAGVQGQAGVKMIVDQKFEFPIFEDSAFLSLMVAVTGQDTSAPFMVGSMLFDAVRDIDPMLYNTSTKLEAKLYAEGNATAEAGIRIADDQTITESETWSNRDGTANTGTTPWYTRLFGLMASLTASAGAEAGFGVDVQQHFADGADRSAGPDYVDLELSLEASAHLSLIHSIPLLSSRLPQLPALDGAMGAKIRWRLRPPSGGGEGDPLFEQARVSVYAKTGETDMYQGEASETEIFLDVTAETFQSLQGFLNSINNGVRFFRRFSVGSTLGRKYLRAAGRQATFNTMLPSQYRTFGFTLEGYIDFETHVSTAQVRSMFQALSTAANIANEDGDALQRLFTDLMNFLNTGEAPSYITDAATSIANTMLESMDTLALHAQAGLRLAAGGQVSEGAKVRLHGSAGAMITLDYNLMGALSAGEEVTVEDIQRLIERGVDSARGYIEMGGEDAVDTATDDDAAAPTTDND